MEASAARGNLQSYWPLVAVCLTAWIFTTPAITDISALRHLILHSIDGSILAMIGSAPLSQREFSLFMNSEYLAAISMFVLLPHLTLSLISNWTILSLIVITLLNVIVGYFQLWVPTEHRDLLFAVSIAIPILIVWLTGHAESNVTRFLSKKPTVVPTKPLLAIIAVLSALNIYVLMPMAVGASIGKDMIEISNSSRLNLYCLRMKSASSPLNNRLVQIVFDTPEYLVLRDWSPPELPDYSGLHATSRGIEGNVDIATMVDMLGQIPSGEFLHLSDFRISAHRRAALVRKAELEGMEAVTHPDIFKTWGPLLEQGATMSFETHDADAYRIRFVPPVGFEFVISKDGAVKTVPIDRTAATQPITTYPVSSSSSPAIR